MNFVEEMKKKAKDYQNSLVLPEGTEERTVQAAAKIVAEKLARKVTLFGTKAWRRSPRTRAFPWTALTS